MNYNTLEQNCTQLINAWHLLFFHLGDD